MNLRPPASLRRALLLALVGATAACSVPTVGGPCDPFQASGSSGDACGQQLYFPTGLVIDPRADSLYVSNGNADLRYSGGTVQAVDLAAWKCAYDYATGKGWSPTCPKRLDRLKCAIDYASSRFTVVPDGCDAALLSQQFSAQNQARIDKNGLCRPDLLDPGIIECDEQLLMVGALADPGTDSFGHVRVGNFAGEMRLQRTVGTTGKGRLWVTVRGDPSITFVELGRGKDSGAPELKCHAGAGLVDVTASCASQRITVRDFNDSSHPLCDKDNPDKCAAIPSEPFGLAYDEGRYNNVGDGVCRNGDPCDAANPCLDGLDCLTGDGICLDQMTRCNATTPCRNKLRCNLPNGETYQHLLVTHLFGGEVTVVDAKGEFPASTPDSTHAQRVVLDVRSVGFGADSAGRIGGFGLAIREPGNPRSLWYATSRVNARLALFRVGFSNIVLPFGTTPLVGPFNAGDDVRDIAFDPCTDRGPGNQGCRAFAVQNHPPSLFTLDTRVDPLRFPAGLPQNTVTDAVSICQGPSHLAFRSQVVTGLGQRNRVYVLCFGANQMAVVDPDQSELVDSVLVGRGPNEIAFNFGEGIDADVQAVPSERRAFVTNYLDNSISVVDLSPGSRTENHVIARIGFTEPPRLQ